jgi:hypothetical protein
MTSAHDKMIGQSARIYKILASASSIKGARNRTFSPWYDVETAELATDR